MSYCVNCGVELDDSAKKCALCDTPVINPAKAENISEKTAAPAEPDRQKSFPAVVFAKPEMKSVFTDIRTVCIMAVMMRVLMKNMNMMKIFPNHKSSHHHHFIRDMVAEELLI